MNTHEHLKNLPEELKDILLIMYQENRTHVRHYEKQRATASNIIMLATVGLVGVAAAGNLTCQDWQVSIAFVILGLYGAMFTAIHYECIEGYRHRAKDCCKALEDLLSQELDEEQIQGKVQNILRMEDCKPEENFPKLRGLPFLTIFRAIWPLTISILGIVVIACILFFKCYLHL